jgi:N-ethylmaleimide reductase
MSDVDRIVPMGSACLTCTQLKETTMNQLLKTFSLGPTRLANRAVMAPMTRSRAIDNLPNELMREYYAQRATAGLIITEGTAPSPDALGYARIPGIYSEAQVSGWRAVTEAVHERGGAIFLQVMHTGRITHALNQPAGARIVAPSAVRAAGQMYTDQQGMVDFPVPEALSARGVALTLGEFAAAARNARAAGFDGVELHAANGYLLEQFLTPVVNRRDDAYGGSIENRSRFVLEATRAAAREIGAERVGVRISPYSTFNDMAAYPEAPAQYDQLVAELAKLGLAYLHIVLTPDPRSRETARRLAKSFGGPVILNGGFDAATADAALAAGDAELISFGRPFIANPDFVARTRERAALATADHTTFYVPGAAGYLDYPALGAAAGAQAL